jgi:hypothetical protein
VYRCITRLGVRKFFFSSFRLSLCPRLLATYPCASFPFALPRIFLRTHPSNVVCPKGKPNWLISWVLSVLRFWGLCFLYIRSGFGYIEWALLATTKHAIILFTSHTVHPHPPHPPIWTTLLPLSARQHLPPLAQDLVSAPPSPSIVSITKTTVVQDLRRASVFQL